MVGIFVRCAFVANRRRRSYGRSRHQNDCCHYPNLDLGQNRDYDDDAVLDYDYDTDLDSNYDLDLALELNLNRHPKFCQLVR